MLIAKAVKQTDNRYLFLGMLIMAFALVWAGCASTGGGKRPPAPEAERLAGDLNAVKAGAAVVDGAKVTLSGGTGLETAFTVPAGVKFDVPEGVTLVVPAGVTLDLSGEGARLILKNGAALTVDGTVNTRGHGNHGNGWVEGGLIIDNGAAVINGGGTLHLSSKGSLLNIGRSRKLTLDGVTLVGLGDNDNSLVQVGEGGALVLKSGAITGNTRANEGWASGGGVRVWKGTFTMEGGTISGNSAVSGKEGSGGGGVEAGEGSVFTMKGGAISGNTISGASANGGGVRVENGGVFTMEGGEISGNSANCGIEARGGGVNMENNAFTMKGGKISGNSVNGNNVRGGGVAIRGVVCVFTMEGGEISGNSANGGEGGGTGGGVFLQSTGDGKALFTMSGGIISGNNASTGGGGVRITNDNMFTMEGGTISGNSAKDYGGGVTQQMGSFTMKGGTISGNSAGRGGGVTVGDGCNFIMEDGVISGNTGGGISFRNNPNWGGPGCSFTMKGGRIQGSTDSDGFTKNTGAHAAIEVISIVTAKWGTGGVYTKGGIPQTGGSGITSSDDTLIAIPAP